MIVLGIVLALLGYFIGIPVIMYIGVVLIVVGAVLWILGSTGRAVGGRKTWY